MGVDTKRLVLIEIGSFKRLDRYQYENANSKKLEQNCLSWQINSTVGGGLKSSYFLSVRSPRYNWNVGPEQNQTLSQRSASLMIMSTSIRPWRCCLVSLAFVVSSRLDGLSLQ